MNPLDVVRLSRLADRSLGRPDIVVGLIDGPVSFDHPDLARQSLQQLSPSSGAVCSTLSSLACVHGTFVAGILAAKRGSAAPAICPDCTLLVRPIFLETRSIDGIPSASPEELALAIEDCVNAGARVLNVSAALTRPWCNGERDLEEALNHAARRKVLVVAAAGNQGTVGGSAMTRHPAVIPVVGCDAQGRPMPESNLGSSISRRGLRAPGVGVTSLGTDGGFRTFRGTSVAAPFVTGALALLWSEFPNADAMWIKRAVMQAGQGPRNTIVPPLLDAWAAYQRLEDTRVH